ncbi:hypothetical protein ERJ75_000101200 [Trypanosoma vivax]|nr:hypothetical protein ERJ75_000101200 [Trypanosoma vivax]
MQRFGDFGYQMWMDRFVLVGVSSVAGALVYPKEDRCANAVLGVRSLACSYRAECVVMQTGLKRPVDSIGLSKTRVVAFTDSLSLLIALSTCPGVV